MLDGEAVVPAALRHGGFVAVPLTTATAALDYACYMASPDVIRIHSDGRWPVEGFTIAQDLALVAEHEDDHRRRRAFTFVLLAPSETEALGCLYLNPLREYLLRAGAPNHVVGETPRDSAMVTFWLRQDQQDNGLADSVVEAVDDWIAGEWPVAGHLFRVLPQETSSRAALDRRNLCKVAVAHPADTRPYLWYRGSTPDAR